MCVLGFAAKVGKTPAYITTRLKLTELCDDAAAAFYQDHIGVGHALLQAKLPAAQQQSALKACFKEVHTASEDKPTRILLPVRNLQSWIASIAAVYEDESLRNFLGYALPSARAQKILSLLEWNPTQKTYLDLMYQPITRAAGGKLLVAPNLFAVANLPRNTLQLTQKRLGEKGDGLLAHRLKTEFLGQGFGSWDDVEYHYGGIEGDCDVVALQGEFLFILECKNSLHPCSTAELRTSCDYIQKARRQLEKFTTIWSKSGFRAYFEKLLQADLSAVTTVVTGAVTGNRMFGGLQIGAANVLGFHELVNFITSGRVVILDSEISGRPTGPLKPEDLRDFLINTPWEKPMLAAMKRRDKVTRYGEIDVPVEDYSLKMVDLAQEWNVPIPEHLKWLLSQEDETSVAMTVDGTTAD